MVDVASAGFWRRHPTSRSKAFGDLGDLLSSSEAGLRIVSLVRTSTLAFTGRKGAARSALVSGIDKAVSKALDCYSRSSESSGLKKSIIGGLAGQT